MEAPRVQHRAEHPRQPIYAGVYAYGRTRTVTRVVDGQAKKSRGYSVPREEWAMFIPNHQEGYISLAAFERIQRQIRENATMKCPLSQGPVRRGKGLVAGLLRCRRCGRKLHVTYSGIRGNVVRYHCRGAAVNHGTDKCISFGGTAVDREVEREVLKALDPESIRAAIVQMDRVQDRRNDQRRALELALRQAEYETQRAFRQYNAVEPENRLVTRELERRWNEALAEEVRLQGQLAQIPEEPGPVGRGRQGALDGPGPGLSPGLAQ